MSKNFIVTGNDYYIKSYDFNQNKIYYIYFDNNIKENHINIFIEKKDEVIKLIEASEIGIIRIWNFHSSLLLFKISFNIKINCICFWNIEYIFIGCIDKTIKLIDIKRKTIIKNYKGHNNRVVSIKKIYHPQYGDCLISQNLLIGKLKIWCIKKK